MPAAAVVVPALLAPRHRAVVVGVQRLAHHWALRVPPPVGQYVGGEGRYGRGRMSEAVRVRSTTGPFEESEAGHGGGACAWLVGCKGGVLCLNHTTPITTFSHTATHLDPTRRALCDAGTAR